MPGSDFDDRKIGAPPVSDWHEPKSAEHTAAMGGSGKSSFGKRAMKVLKGSGGLVGTAAKLFAKGG